MEQVQPPRFSPGREPLGQRLVESLSVTGLHSVQHLGMAELDVVELAVVAEEAAEVVVD